MRCTRPLLLSLFLFGAMLLTACASDEQKITLVTLAFEQGEQIPDAPTLDRIEFDVQRVGNTLYTCWSQQRDGEAAHDIYFATADVGSSLDAASEQVTNTTNDSRRARIAVDSNNNVVIVWEEGTSPARAIQFVERSATLSTFGAISDVATNAADNENPHCHFDDEDNLHVAWDVGGEIFYRRRPEGGSMSTAESLPLDGASDAILPTITSDDDANIYVIWRHTDADSFLTLGGAASETNGQSGSFVGIIMPIPALSLGMYEPQIARAPGVQQFYVVYRIGSTSQRRIRLTKFGLFGFSLLFSRDLHIDTTSSPTGSSPDIDTVIVDGTAKVYVTWEDDGAVSARGSLNDGSNIGPLATPSEVYSTSSSAETPRIAAGSDNAVVLWDAIDSATTTVRAGFLAEAAYELNED